MHVDDDSCYDRWHGRNLGGEGGVRASASASGVGSSSAVAVASGSRPIGLGQGERRTQWEGWDVIVFDEEEYRRSQQAQEETRRIRFLVRSS